jgi:hypothetical protein
MVSPRTRCTPWSPGTKSILSAIARIEARIETRIEAQLKARFDHQDENHVVTQTDDNFDDGVKPNAEMESGTQVKHPCTIS